MNKETLEEAAQKYRKTTPNQMFGDELGFINGAKWQQETLCDSEVIQKIRASKSDAEARRIIRTI